MIVPTVFQVPINGRVARPKRGRSCDRVNDQSLGRSGAGFPGSRAGSRDTSGYESRDWSRVRSRVWSCDLIFPGSRVFGVILVTWLELGLGAGF